MEKISHIKKRILQYIEDKGITKQEFCNNTGISYANMKGRSLESEIGGAQLLEILSTYKDISPEWLLTGEGEMLRNGSVGIIQNGVKNKIEKSPVTINSVNSKECEELREKIKHLEDLLEAKNEIINLLKNK